MLNIGKLAAGGENYYLGEVASGVEDYYTGSGEAPGFWVGESAAGLGLDGLVDADDLHRVLGGLDPRAPDERLGSFKSGRSVPGFDCTFRAPKSVSVLYGVGDEATSGTVRDAHDAAVTAALGYLQEQAGYSRRGAGGAEAVAVEGFVAAAFRHRSSRAGDPLLHTHVLVANLGKAVDDGKWRTLDARRLYTQAKTAGYLYQATLRDELTRRLGVEWGPVRNGCADVAGVPVEVLEAFSQRRAEILARMAERGESSAKAAQTATLATRKAKDYGVRPESLTEGWRTRAAALGFDAERVAALVSRLPEVAEVDAAAVVERLAGAGGLTAHASTFTRRDVLRACCDQLPHGAPIEQVEQLADALLGEDAGVAVPLLPAAGAPVVDAAVHEAIEGLADRCDALGGLQLSSSTSVARSVAAVVAAGWSAQQIVEALTERELGSAEDPAAVLAWRAQRLASEHGVADAQRLDGPAVIRRADGRVVPADRDEARYSTPELLALEREVIEAAAGRRDAGTAVADASTVEDALAARPTITGEQAAMVRQLTSSGAGVEVVVGKAGAGKTFALDAARQAWQSSGVRVVGCAVAARAALELSESAGIDSYTIDALLADVERQGPGDGLTPGSVLVVDEAGMAGTRKLARLAAHVAAADAKLVLVGDHHQLPEVDAGGVFRGLAARLPVIELADNRRQRQTWERAALDELREGRPTEALAAYASSGRVVVGDTAEAVREQLVGDWWAARSEHGVDGVMIAARVADVEDLNERARDRLAADGLLAGPQLTAGTGKTFQAGDEIVTLRNNRRLGVVNGSRGRVERVDTEACSLAVRLADGKSVTLPGDYLEAGYVTHGYAITGHKAQGMTTEQAWVLGSDASYREWGYVAMSRGREANRIYVVAGQDAAVDEAHTHGHESAAGNPLTTLTRAWERSRGQQLAIDQGEVDVVAASVSPSELARRRAALQERLATVPAAPDRRTEWTVEERDTARGQLAAAQQRHAAAQERLAQAPRGPGRARRAERSEAQTAVSRTAGDVAAWQQRLDELDERLAGLQTREDHDGDVEEDLVAARTVDAALLQVAKRRAQAAEFDPPAYLTAAVGARPDEPDRRRRWRTGVEAIEVYRARYDVDDRVQALGERPTATTQRLAYERAAEALSAAQQQRLTVSRNDMEQELS